MRLCRNPVLAPTDLLQLIMIQPLAKPGRFKHGKTCIGDLLEPEKGREL